MEELVLLVAVLTASWWLVGELLAYLRQRMAIRWLATAPGWTFGLTLGTITGGMTVAGVFIGEWAVSVFALFVFVAVGIYLRKSRACKPRPKRVSAESRLATTPVGRLAPIRLPERVMLTYRNAQGEQRRRTVRVMKVDWLERKFTGFCEHAGALRTFRVSRIEGDVTRMETGELLRADDWYEALGRSRLPG